MTEQKMQRAERAWQELEAALAQARRDESLRAEVMERGHLLYKRRDQWTVAQRHSYGLQVVALVTEDPPVERPSRRVLAGLWRASGERLRGEPVFQAASVLLLDARDAQGSLWDAELYMELLRGDLGGRLAPLVAQALVRHKMQRRAWLYRWLQHQEGDWSQVHLHLLSAETSRNMREQAALLLLRQPNASPALMETTRRLQKSRKAQDRALAVFILRRLETPQARDQLRQMQEEERAQSVAQAIKEALEAYNPTQRALREIASQERHGIYQPGQPLGLKEGLEELRALIHEPPTAVLWCRACNLLERLRPVGGLPVALDYLRPVALGWPRELRLLPWSWRGQEALEPLAGLRHGPVWLPVEVLWREPGGAAVADALEEIQGRAQVRKLKEPALRRFGGYLERGWSWCAERQVAPELLALQLDAGAPDPSKVTSAVEAWMGFGVVFRRGYQLLGAHGRREGLRRARVELAPDHPAREEFLMSRRKKYLDLLDLEVLP